MIDAAFLRETLNVDELVPEVYAGYRPLVADALAFFLTHLSAPRLEGIFAAQAALPDDASIFARAVLFVRACPALHKLGQVIARHRELDPDLRRRLHELESMEPRTPMSAIRPIIQRELAGAIDAYHIDFAAEALAEGSVAVIVPCTWTPPSPSPGTPGEGRGGGSGDRVGWAPPTIPPAVGGAHPTRLPGVIKVLIPAAVQHLAEDLDILALLADHLDARGDSPVAFRETLAEVAELLTHEVRVADETANLAEAHRQFAATDVRIPAILPFSTPAMLAMERITGVKVTQLAADRHHHRDDLAGAIARALVADILFSRDDERLFHADPHAGNLVATDDGKLAILDWSLTGRISNPQRSAIAQIAAGALCFDAERMTRAVGELATNGPTALIPRLVDQSLRQLAAGRLPGPDWVMRLLDSLALAGVKFPGDLLLFRKAFFTLEGVIEDVSPGQSLDALLSGSALAHLACEWPTRWLRPMTDRDFPTHLSTFDLMSIAARAPANLMTWWMRSFA